MGLQRSKACYKKQVRQSYSESAANDMKHMNEGLIHLVHPNVRNCENVEY